MSISHKPTTRSWVPTVWYINFGLLACLLCTFGGCKKDSETHAIPSASASGLAVPTRVPLVSEEAIDLPNLANSISFDLVTSSEHALLLYAQRHQAAYQILAQKLSLEGSPQGKPVVVYQPPQADKQRRVIGELSAIQEEGQLGLAWIEHSADKGHVYAMLGDAGGQNFGQAQLLGNSDALPDHERGQVMLHRTFAGQISALYRGKDEKCESDPAQICSNLVFQTILPDGNQPPRPWLFVPNLCSHPIVGYLSKGSVRYYAICNRKNKESLVSLFAAQPNPAYAMSSKMFAGCSSQAMNLAGEEMIVSAYCHRERSLRRMKGTELVPGTTSWNQTEIRCTANEPSIVAKDGLGTEFLLKDIRGPLHALLPRRFTPSGTRAIWTGKSLLRAYPRRQRLYVQKQALCVKLSGI
jgi:hypothetical protein